MAKLNVKSIVRVDNSAKLALVNFCAERLCIQSDETIATFSPRGLGTDLSGGDSQLMNAVIVYAKALENYILYRLVAPPELLAMSLVKEQGSAEELSGRSIEGESGSCAATRKFCDDLYQHETLCYYVNANKVLLSFDQVMFKRTVKKYFKQDQCKSVKTVVALDAEKRSSREINLADSKNGLLLEQHL
ncbi:hypothetical protein BGZ58_001313 [Dissophora ornata]|nr:hypothetical protein BGZ58_001313 [Dissophora ornata]